MTYGEETKTERTVPWPLIVCAFLFTAVLLWAAVIALQAWFHTELAGEVQRKIVDTPFAEVDRFLQDQETDLTRYAKIEGDSTRIRLPIERAMELIELEDREGR
jgi:hypothetical protein